jgi:predicted Rossmann fold nucleotide-binding protein DprA/Smf involved in DNA uptake
VAEVIGGRVVTVDTEVAPEEGRPETPYSNVDPRLLKKFLRDPNFRYGYSSVALANMEDRVLTHRQRPGLRDVYAEVKKGARTAGEIVTLTGLPMEEVTASLKQLADKGYVKLSASKSLE